MPVYSWYRVNATGEVIRAYVTYLGSKREFIDSDGSSWDWHELTYVGPIV
jgi:hypothetical protein